MKVSREGRGGKGRLQPSLRDRSLQRPTDTESARRVAKATKWKKMEEDVLPAAAAAAKGGGASAVGGGRGRCLILNFGFWMGDGEAKRREVEKDGKRKRQATFRSL